MKKIPADLLCVCYDDILDGDIDPNDVNWFLCERCVNFFGTDPDVRFPKFCPNCGMRFEWVDKA